MQNNLDFDSIDKFSQSIVNSLDFTKRAENGFYDAVDLSEFRDKDAETIFDFLNKEIRLIPFGDYLKRYIYLKAGMTGEYNEIDIRDYQHIIVDSFAENYTPKSFSETTAKIGSLAKNWLTQSSVNRSTVFLLGFGLNMNDGDVSDFLTKALRERDFNFKESGEAIYWYCYRNGLKFPKMLALKRQLENITTLSNCTINDDKTINIRKNMKKITNDETLLRYLADMRSGDHPSKSSTTVSNRFNVLYMNCKSLIADFFNADEQERRSAKVWTSDDVTEGDVEKVLCCGTPVNREGNLEKLSESMLSKHFISKRFSRQHIAEILANAVAIDRFDLMTLNFFIFSQDERYADDNKNRYIAFVDSTNEILNECMMGELYVANPYECFLLMCILSDCPLATYSDVWEMSYDNPNTKVSAD